MATTPFSAEQSCSRIHSCCHCHCHCVSSGLIWLLTRKLRLESREPGGRSGLRGMKVCRNGQKHVVLNQQKILDWWPFNIRLKGPLMALLGVC